jgi:ATP/maltotriose-dependent transcriptional regulator MalT
MFLLGRWDEALAITVDEGPRTTIEGARGQLVTAALIHAERGDLRAAEEMLTDAEALRASDSPDSRLSYAAVEARLLRARGDASGALAAAERGLEAQEEMGISHTMIKISLAEGAEAALTLGDLDAAEKLLAIPEDLDRGQLSPLLKANTARLRARLDAARGSHDEVDERFRSAAALYQEFGIVFHQAVAQVEHAEWLIGQDRGDEADMLLAEARETFERLGAKPWLDRALERLERDADQLQPARQTT